MSFRLRILGAVSVEDDVLDRHVIHVAPVQDGKERLDLRPFLHPEILIGAPVEVQDVLLDRGDGEELHLGHVMRGVRLLVLDGNPAAGQ